MKYVAVREFIFSYLPWKIPHALHNVFVLSGLVFGAATVGYYRATGSNLLEQIALSATYPIRFIAQFAFSIFQDVDSGKRNSPDWLVLFVQEIASTRRFREKALLRLKDWESRTTIMRDSQEVMNAQFSSPFRGNVLGCVGLVLSIAAAAAIVLIAISVVPVPGITFLAAMGLSALAFGIFIAWRWVLTIAGMFIGLLLINEIYVRWISH